VNYVRTDQYTHIDRHCPMRTDLHPVDDVVEVALGEARFGDSTLRLIFDDPDTCLLLTEALHDAGNRLAVHLRAKRSPDPALSRLDPAVPAPTDR
jgi:hypothetical protein